MKPDGRITSDETPFEGREFAFTGRDFKRIAAMLYADAGIRLTDAKAALVYSRLVKRLRALGIESFERYCELVAGQEGGEERNRMTAALTTNVTRFFREPHHFEHLRDQVLPPLLGPVRHGSRLRIWSAGCSSGEEAYSIALTILSVMPDAADFDVRVLATDINSHVLQQGVEGAYSDQAIEPVSRAMLADWFTPLRRKGEKGWRVGDRLRTLVAFRQLNLMDPWPMTAAYQAIFCRNVLIYFDAETQVELWRRMAPLLAPEGRLYVGHSERVTGEPSLTLEGLTTYRRALEPAS